MKPSLRHPRVGSILTGAALLAMVFLASCSQEKNAGVETTNGITVSVQLDDGRPARGARYFLVAQAQWQERVSQNQNPVLDSGLTDENGQVYFDSVPQGLGLEVFSASQAGHLVLRDSAATETNLALAPASRLSGTYDGSAQVIYLAGTSLSAPVQADGSFSFPSVPPGTYGVMVQGSSGLTLDYVAALPSGSHKQIESVAPSATILLLEDFNDGDRLHRFAEAMGGPVWFWTADSASSIVELPLNPEGNFRVALTDSSAHNGLSLHIHANIEAGIPDRYANLGLNFLGTAYDANPWMNLCGMDSLTFWTKGTGTVILQFVTPLFHLDEAHPILYGAEILLTESWKKVTLSPNMILPMNGRVVADPAPTWSEQCSQVRNLTMTFDSPTEFWLDDISFAGIGVVQQFHAFVSTNP